MEWVKVIVSVVPLVLKPLKAVTKHMAYPFQVGSNISSLELATRELKAVKDDFQTDITNAERQDGAPTEQIKQWLNKVEAIEQKATEIQNNYEQLCRCLWNISPNLWSNYKISGNAAKKTIEMNDLLKNSKSVAFRVIAQMPPPLAQEMPASTSKSTNLELALQEIQDDKHSSIGIWGMGGVGKTHLLKQINNELSRDDTFSVVVFVTCSKECSEEKVQKEIIEKLGLKNDSVERSQGIIFNFLKEKSFVLLLDDLWNRIDLETIGIPNPLGIVGTYKRKVVLTTRSTEVCGQMEVRKMIKVNVLNDDDAWLLFKEKATEETINSDPLIQKCAMDVVKELGGLPLALITVGRAMYDKKYSNEWEQAIESLEQARLHDIEFSSLNGSVFHTLKFSFDNLKNETLKQCFLHCSLYPEDYHIPKDFLIDLWMGLGFIDRPSIHTAYNDGYSYIRRLQAVCLLETIDDDSIKMHDVIRDMALWIANQGEENDKWVVQTGTNQKHQLITVSHNTEKLSLIRNMHASLSFSVPCSSSKLSTLLLSEILIVDSKIFQLDSFSKLEVLDLSYNFLLETFPIEICNLEYLKFLNLSENPGLKSLPPELGALIHLKYFYLKNVGINCTIPIGVITKLKALQVLDMRSELFWEPEKRSVDLPSLVEELQGLTHFKALGITISNIREFQVLSQTCSVPVRWLHVEYLEMHSLGGENCLSLSSFLLQNPQLQNNLVFLYLGRMDFEMMKFVRTSEHQSILPLERLKELSIRQMTDLKEVIWKDLNPSNVFPRLQVLHFESCNKLKSISWVVCLPCISEIGIAFCKNIKQLICIDELNKCGLMVSPPFFPFLKKMILNRNDELESVFDHIVTIHALEFLHVESCNKLKKLPFKTNNPPKKLNLWGTEDWWNSIEMDDSSHKSLLQPAFTKMNSIWKYL